MFEYIHWALKVSRFPFFWFCCTGPFLLGVFAARDTIEVTGTLLWVLWLMIPGSIFFCALNDAFDQETDAHNPRKQGFERAALVSESKSLIKLAVFSLISSLPLLIFWSDMTMRIIFSIWAVSLILYNAPPVRMKSVPVANVVFGGVGGTVPLAVMGYVFVTGILPPVEAIGAVSVLFAAGHIAAGDALDYEFDKKAKIKTVAVLLGSYQRTLFLGFVLYCLFTFILGMYGLYTAAVFSLAFPLYTMYLLVSDHAMQNRKRVFIHFQILHTGYWALVVAIYTTIDILRLFIS